jgi:uncharacterized protein
MTISTPSGSVPAGDFDTWLESALTSLRRRTSLAVPCGDCRGCCSSGHFVHVGADEQDALAAIPRNVQFRAPGLPQGNIVIGFAGDGHCPMLAARECSIYERRPQTCRTFDCRVLAAARLLEEGRWSERINLRVRAWRFTYASEESVQRHDAVARAAGFIKSNASFFPGRRVPTRSLDIAVLAVKVHEVFARSSFGTPPAELATAVVESSRRFESSGSYSGSA